MNKVQQSIHDNVVQPALARIAGSVQATVVDFDAKTNLASVRYGTDNPTNDEIIIKTRVPYTVSPGLKKTGLFPGDNVVLNFLNNSHQHPYIVELLDKEYIFQTRNLGTSHKRMGSNATDYYSTRTGESW